MTIDWSLWSIVTRCYVTAFTFPRVVTSFPLRRGSVGLASVRFPPFCPALVTAADKVPLKRKTFKMWPDTRVNDFVLYETKILASNRGIHAESAL